MKKRHKAITKKRHKLQQFLDFLFIRQEFPKSFLAGFICRNPHWLCVILQDIFDIGPVGILTENDSDRRILAFYTFFIIQDSKVSRQLSEISRLE